MSNALVRDLADCSEFRQTLLARPPALVHATAGLLLTLLAAALAWLALTDADLVVRAGGRVRPVVTPTRVVLAGNGEALSASPGGQVEEVRFRPGDVVRLGQVLLRLNTGRLDIERAKRRQSIRAGEEELAKGAELLESQRRQYEADEATTRAELQQAEEEVRQAKRRRAIDLEQARAALLLAQREEERLLRLLARGGASQAEVDKAAAQVREAKTALAKAELPVEEGKVKVLRARLERAPDDYAAKRQELEMRLTAKRGEVEGARKDLEELELQRHQATLLAPCDGVVTSGEVKVGDVLERGKAVVEIAEQRGFLFEAVVPSEEVGRLKVGMPVRVKLDAFDYQKYGTAAGTVVFIAPDSSVPEGQRAATYLVRIELDGDEVGRGDHHGRIKLGMLGTAEIVTGRESLLPLLARKIRQTISLG
jgi:HlyD family type I secretion membrane fusion protein